MRRQTIRIYLLTAVVCGVRCQTPDVDYTAEDRAIFERYVHETEGKKTLPSGELILETARFFLKTPYVASTLEKEPEHLVVNLREMDCTTFVENCVALTQTMKERPQPSFEDFCRNLRQLRYRDGKICSYADRLHYFSDWIYENERKGKVRDVTRTLGGKPYRVNVYFMSEHPERYPALQSHPDQRPAIHDREQEISARDIYAMIPTDNIAACSKGMKNGDIVCFVTRIKGLDISHLGFLCRQGTEWRFIHASSSAGKVIVDSHSLAVYAKNIRTTAGLMIVRPE